MKIRLVTHLLTLGAVIVVATGSRFLLKEKHGLERLHLAVKAAERRSMEIEENWRALSYTNLSGAMLSARIAGGTNWSSIQLSDTQDEKLRERLSELFEYLQNPAFDEYYRLKTRGLHYVFVPSSGAMANFDMNQTEMEKHFAVSELVAVRYFWDWVHSGTNSSPVRLTSVVLDSFMMARSTTNSVPHILVGPVAQGFTGASEMLNPGFDYTTSPKTNTESQDQFLHMSFFARADGSQNVGPVYVSLQWLEQDQQWAFSRLITDVWLGVKTLF